MIEDKVNIKKVSHNKIDTVTYDLDNFTYFELHNIDASYINTIESLFYEKDGDRYFKKYPASLKNINSLKTNFHKYAVDMIEQFGYFKPTMWQESLVNVIDRLEKNSINYSLIGGASLLVRGIPIKTHDLDIMIDSNDIDLINEIFDDCIIEPIIDTDGWVVKYFGVAFLHARIDLSFEPQESADHPEPTDFGPYAMKNLETVEWNGYKIKVPPIELYLNVSEKRGRTERVNLIKEYINKG